MKRTNLSPKFQSIAVTSFSLLVNMYAVVFCHYTDMDDAFGQSIID